RAGHRPGPALAAPAGARAAHAAVLLQPAAARLQPPRPGVPGGAAGEPRSGGGAAPMSPPALHQFHPITATGDAVTNGALFTRQVLRELGFESRIYAQHVAPGLEGDVLPHPRLPASCRDPLLVHHSHGHDLEPWLRRLQAPQFLVYHNVTPPR